MSAMPDDEDRYFIDEVESRWTPVTAGLRSKGA